MRIAHQLFKAFNTINVSPARSARSGCRAYAGITLFATPGGRTSGNRVSIIEIPQRGGHRKSPVAHAHRGTAFPWSASTSNVVIFPQRHPFEVFSRTNRGEPPPARVNTDFRDRCRRVTRMSFVGCEAWPEVPRAIRKSIGTFHPPLYAGILHFAVLRKTFPASLMANSRKLIHNVRNQISNTGFTWFPHHP